MRLSAPEYASDLRCAARLVQLVAEYEDDLHRMAHTVGSARNVRQWAAPNAEPPAAGYVDIGDVLAHQGHYSTVNFGSVGQVEDEPGADHLVFRLFDASLQPGRMQAQVKLAAALTDYAARHRDQSAGPRRPVGSALRNSPEQGPGPDAELAHPDQVDEHAWAAGTAGVRELIDRLFRRDVDKRQIAAL